MGCLLWAAYYGLLTLGYLLLAAYYGLLTMDYLLWAVTRATRSTHYGLPVLPTYYGLPALLTMAAGGLPRLLRHALRQTACRRDCRRRGHIRPPSAAAAVQPEGGEGEPRVDLLTNYTTSLLTKYTTN